MKKDLNLIKNNYLIKIGNNWEFFFLEDNEPIASPVNSYYFLSQDLSINISLRLKWALYGWFFFKSLSEALDDPDYWADLTFSDCINPNFETTKQPKKLFLDGNDVDSFELFKIILETEYTKAYHDQNSLISFKLKLNVSEFLIMQDELFPRLGELE